MSSVCPDDCTQIIFDKSPDLCRIDRGLFIDADYPTIHDVIYATNNGYSKVYSKCFGGIQGKQKHKIDNFRKLFNDDPHWKEDSPMGNVSQLNSCWGGDRYIFHRIQPIKNIPKCCKEYTKNSDKQKELCDVDYCKGSNKCNDSEVLEGCLSFFTKKNIDSSLLDIHADKSARRYDRLIYKNTIGNLKNLLNPTACNIDLVKSNKELLISSNLPYLLNGLLKIIIDIDDEEKRKDLVELCNSNLMRFLVTTNDRDVLDNLKSFCNNDTLFTKDNFKSADFTNKYKNICNCFWNKDKDNGNPVHENDIKIKELKNADNLPKEIRDIIKYETDIEPSGPNECWYNKCIDNNTNLSPTRGDKCPSMNIASCFSNLNFENLGEINADEINIISHCSAIINSKKFELGKLDPKDYKECSQANYPFLEKPDVDLEKKYKNFCNNQLKSESVELLKNGCKYCNDIKSCISKNDNCNDITDNTRICKLTGFEDKQYLETFCKKYKCKFCDDIDSLLTKIDDYKTISCNYSEDDTREDLEYRCNVIKEKSTKKDACDWCSSIDDIIQKRSNNGDEEPKPSGLSTAWIVGIIIGIILLLLIIGIIIFISIN